MVCIIKSNQRWLILFLLWIYTTEEKYRWRKKLWHLANITKYTSQLVYGLPFVATSLFEVLRVKNHVKAFKMNKIEFSIHIFLCIFIFTSKWSFRKSLQILDNRTNKLKCSIFFISSEWLISSFTVSSSCFTISILVWDLRSHFNFHHNA